MNFLFLIAFIIILITVPFWIFAILLSLLKFFINIKFQISGLYYITDIQLELSNNEFNLSLAIDSIKVIFGWPRTRFLVEGIKISFNINNSEFKEKNISSNNKINDISFIKEKFAGILKSKLWTNDKDKNSLLSFGEINNIDDMVKHKKSSMKNRFVLYVLRFFDIYIDRIKATLKFQKRPIFYSIRIRKIITGVIKSPNKKSQIDIVGGLYDLEIREHIGKILEKFDDKNQTIKHRNKLKKYVSKDIYINKKSNKDTIKYRLIKLSNVAFKIAFIDGFFPLTNNYTIMNKVSIMIEGGDLVANISKRSADNILSLIIGIILSINNNKEKSSSAKNRKNKDPVDVSSYLKSSKNYEEKICIEQILLKKVDSELKKIELKIQNVKINLYNDNYIYKYLTIFCNNIKIERNSTLYLGSNINNDLHLIKREMELHFMEVKVFQFKNKNLSPVTEVPIFDISLKDNIIYHSNTQSATLTTNISGKLSDVEVFVTTKNVNKIIQLVLTIMDGIDIIEYVLKAKNNSKYRIDHEVKDSTIIDIDLSNINAYVYSPDYYVNISDVGIKINMENLKGVSKIVTLDLPKVNLTFSPKLKDSSLNNIITSNVIIDGFKIVIDDKKANGGERWYNLSFADTLVVTTDRHILAILKFVSEVADFILREDVEKKFEKTSGKYGVKLKKRAKKGTKLVWNKLEAVIIFHENDITHSFFENFVFILDKLITIPKAYMYHNTILKKNNLFRKFIDIDNFSMEYYTPTDFNLSCDDFYINYYESYMARPIAHIIFFFTFFPDWMNYYITYKFVIDEESQLEKYEIMTDKVINRKIKLTRFHFDINDNPISSASILHAQKEELNNNNMYSVISYLKKIKSDLLTLTFNGIDLDLVTTFKVSKNLNKGKNDYNFYDRILINSKIELNIPNTKINLEGIEIFNMGNIYYKYTTKKDFFDFNPNKALTELILYDRSALIKKKIYFESKLDVETIIKLDNDKFIFRDIIVFDETLTFIFKTFNNISEIPIKNCQTTLLCDRIPKYTKKVLFASLTGLNGEINSVDPKTEQIYMTLDIKAKEISYLNMTEMQDLKVLNKGFRLSLHYFLFGFSPKQKSGFPLFSLPLCELNQDSLENILKINIPTDVPPDSNSYTASFTEIYNKELNELVLKTKSLTIFINYQYIFNFYKIFNVFYAKTFQLRKEKKKTDINKNSKDKESETTASTIRRKNKLNTFNSRIRAFSPKNNKKISRNSKYIKISEKVKKKKKIIKLVLFDLKIIYLLEYKDDYKNILSFHKFVEEHKYFGFIFRFYSFNMSYINNNSDNNLENEFSSMVQFSTVSFLDVDNLSDEPFFQKDSELKSILFNLKNIDNFNTFMGLNKENTSKFLNNDLEEFIIKKGYKIKESIKKIKPENDNSIVDNDYIDLTFDNRHTFLKISEFIFKREKKSLSQEQIIKLLLKNCKLTFNKFIKDVIYLITSKDLFLIIDKIILKKSKEKDKKEKETKGDGTDRKINKKRSKNIDTNSNNQINEQSIENLNTSRIKKLSGSMEIDDVEEEEEVIAQDEEEVNKPTMILNFEINNPQIVVQNEIKGSALLLICKEPMKLVFTNYLFSNDIKNYQLSIHCRQLSLYSVLKSDKQNAVIYWMGDPKVNKYHLNEEDFGKIIESPKIDFIVKQIIESASEKEKYNNNFYYKYINSNEIHDEFILDKSNQKIEKDNYNIKSLKHLIIDKITGNFISVYFDDFLNIISVLIFDRGFSLNQEKKSNTQVIEDLKKYKPKQLRDKIKALLPSNKISNKIKGDVKFELSEVTFNLCEDISKSEDKKKNNSENNNKNKNILANFKPLLQFQMKDFLGNQTIREDKSSETSIFISKLLIKNIEHEMSQPVFQPLYPSKSNDLKDKSSIITLITKDRYIKLETGSMWYVIDEFDFNISPFSFHISKKQIMFILDFFFNNRKNKWDEDKKKNEKKDENIPTYFRQFKIDDIKCLLNFEYSPEASVFNVPMTKLNIIYFVKNNKLYPFSNMANRFVGHCKQELIKNFPNILSSVFGNKNYSYNHPQKKEEDEEAAKRKLLFGDK